MSKNKSSSKASKPSKAVDVLTKVKDAAIVKPAQQAKAKSKEIAKAVIGKEEKAGKKSKKAREPTPESASEAEDSASDAESASSESSSSDSENEKKTKAPVNGKTNGAKKVSEAASSDESDSDASSDADSDADVAAAPANGALKSGLKTNGKHEPVDAVNNGAKKGQNAESGDESASSEDDEASGSSDSDSADESEAEEAQPKVNKRKADSESQVPAKKTKTDEGTSAQSANLFVGNLSWNVDEAWLREAFEEFGEVSRVQLMTDRATGRSKGFGYVEFANAEDAAKAHEGKQGAELDGRTLNVDFANARPNTQDRQDNRRKSYGDQTGEPSDTLFVGNLSFDVGQEAVTEAFSPHGTILGIRLPTDRETGQPKGFGYVTFSSVDEATAGLQAMQGAYIANRPIRLDYSQPRPQNGDSPARGRGGFGGRGRGGFGDRGGRGGRGGFGGRGGRGGFGDRGGRGSSRGNTTNRGGFGDFAGKKMTF